MEGTLAGCVGPTALPATSAAGAGAAGLIAATLILALVLGLRRRGAVLPVLAVCAVMLAAALVAAPAAAATCSPSGSGTAAAGTSSTPAPTTGLAFSSTVFKAAGGEPNVSVSPSGRVVLVDGLGGDSPATLYRSTDYGKTFTHLTPAFANEGGEDWDMRFLDDHTIVAADLSLGSGIYIHRSTDGGDTWTDTQILTDQYDRPWLDHFGTDMVYVVAKGFDGIPYLFRSNDGGQSFGLPPIPLLVYGLSPVQGGPDPVSAFVTNQNAYVDHMVVDQHTGDVYVLYGIDTAGTYTNAPPVGVANQLYVAHLENGQMISHPVHLGAADESFISGFNWITVDQAGTVYVLANGSINGHHSARLSYSTDHGATWSPLVDLGEPGAANVYGSIAGGDPGVLSLVYLRGSNENPDTVQDWHVEMAQVIHANTATPVVTRVRPLAAAMHTQDICFDGILCGLPGFGQDRNLLDYIWNAVGPDGTAWAVISSDGPATGGQSGKTPDVVLLRQTAGPSHGHGVQS